MNEFATNWDNIWNKKNIDGIEKLPESVLFQQMIKANGFDSKAGCISLVSWNNYIKWIGNLMGLRPTDKIFEVGCGCGAFLYNFYKNNHVVSGIDYSANLIKISKQIMSNMIFEKKEAIDMETKTKFDVVVSNSIFFYFKDYDYAKQVLTKMIHKSERVIGVFDMPNLRLKEESEKARRSLIKDYDKKYQGLQHLYYYKKWFLEIGEENELNISFYDQNIDNYNNNKYRFNVIMFKKDK